MKPFDFQTLRARLTALLVLPVVLILLVAGVSGFIYTRDRMLGQWHETVILQLKRAAHAVEMRLAQPVQLMEIFSRSGSDSPQPGLLEAIVRRLETLPGVVRVKINWHFPASGGYRPEGMRAVMGGGGFMQFHRGTFTKMSAPKIDEQIGEQTVSMTMILMDAGDTPVGNLEIIIRFDFLMADISTAVWWQDADACIADKSSGKIVFSSARMQGRQQLGDTGDPLEGKLLGSIDRDLAGTIWGSGFPPGRIAGFHSLETFPWALVVFADGKTLLRPMITFRNSFIIGAAVLILVVYGIIRLNADRVSKTIRLLSRQAERIAAGNYGDKIPVPSHDEIGRLAGSFNTMMDGLRERDLIRNTFGRYVDPDFARTLMKQPEAARLGGRRQDVIILMADIRGFTPMVEGLSPEDTIDLLNRYFSAIIPLVQRHRGIIVDFVGDAMLAFFEPLGDLLADTAQRCVRCALAMHTAMDLLNRQLAARDLPALHMGIGINSGPVVVGNIGSETRKKYGIVGAAVNTTQRIQEQSAAGEILVSATVYEMVKSQATVERVFSTSLKGVAAAVRLIAIGTDPQQPPTT
jgi:class 3 adenylate cyclase